MARRPEARYRITAEDRTQNALRSVESGLERLRTTGIGLQTLFATLGAAFSFREVIRNTVRQEAALRQLEQRVTSTGQAAGFSAEQLAEMAGGLQRITTYGDEAVMEMQALLLTFTNIRGDVFVDAQEAVLNLATAMGTSATSAAQQLGRALNDPVAGLSALSRAGVQFSESQRQLIRDMVAANDVAGAQRVILAELETQFGGAARAARDTFGGSLQALGNAFGDLLEVNEGLDDARNAVEELVTLLQDPATIDAVNRLTSAMITGFTKATQVVSGLNLLLFGPSDEIMQIDDAIRDLDRKIAGVQMELVAAQVEGWVAGEQRLNDQLEKLLQERAALVDSYWRKLDERAQKEKQTTGDAVAPDAGPAAAVESEEFRKAAEAMERRLGLLGRETVEQQTLFEIERGRYAELAENEQQALLAVARRIDARQAEIQASREAAQAEEQAAQALERYNEQQERAARAVRDMLDPLEPLRRELEALQVLLDEGRLSWEEWADAVLLVQERMDEMQVNTAEAVEEVNQYAIQAARNIQSAFADFLFDPFQQGLRGMLAGFADIIRRMLAEALAARLAEALFGNIGGGQMGGAVGGMLAGIFHSGGVVGAGGSLRMMDPSVFLGARRYHAGGLASDEVPAILQRGEEVLTRDDPRHQENGGRMELEIGLAEGLMVSAMRSRDVEQAILRVISRNRGAVLQEIG
jgi:hypothetical protein